MSNTVCTVCIALSVVNWLLFVWLAVITMRAQTRPPAAPQSGIAAHDSVLDTIGDQGAKLAAAFKAAGPMATAATLSILFMLIAAIAGGITDLHGK